ncbi:MAG: hypothetical protein J5654_04945 [Victivallales bacterium]|nr:hypothetical protein [Victivallales bacterium]
MTDISMFESYCKSDPTGSSSWERIVPPIEDCKNPRVREHFKHTVLVWRLSPSGVFSQTFTLTFRTSPSNCEHADYPAPTVGEILENFILYQEPGAAMIKREGHELGRWLSEFRVDTVPGCRCFAEAATAPRAALAAWINFTNAHEAHDG